MKKIILLINFIILCSISGLEAKNISETDAKIVAEHFCKQISAKRAMKSANFILNKIDYQPESIQNPQFYIFGNKNCFIIVSADDNSAPIIAYSFDGTIATNVKNDSFDWYLRAANDHIKANLSSANNPRILSVWNNLLSEQKQPEATILADSDKEPLVKTLWNQSPFYNNLCPTSIYDSSQRAITGCVATALAQILKYYEWPNYGFNSMEYSLDDFGDISCDYSFPVYNWHLMPKKLDSSSLKSEVDAVALLMFNCGVAAYMNYGVDASGAWGAYTYPFTLPLAMNMNESLTYISRDSIENVGENWEDYVKNELDNNRPVYYEGHTDSAGHAFVCDGYQNNFDSTRYYHFNWGWGGYANGYFSLDDLAATNKYHWNYNQVILINLMPDSSYYKKIGFYSFINLPSDTINYGQSKSVNFKISNLSSEKINGDVFIALFDDNYNFIKYLDVKKDLKINAGSNSDDINLTFNNSEALQSGDYYIGAYFKHYRNGLQRIANFNNGIDYKKIYVKSQESTDSKMILDNSIKIKPDPNSKSFPLRVLAACDNLDTACQQFNFFLKIYDSSNNYVCSSDTIKDTNMLAGYIEPLSFIINNDSKLFKNDKYTFYLYYQNALTNESFLVNSSDYLNPVAFTIIDYSIQVNPDNNFSEYSAKNIAVNFKNDSAIATISSSYVCDDNPNYFSLDLPTNSAYRVKFRFLDEFSTFDNNYYFSSVKYSIKGEYNDWSQYYCSNQILDTILNNGGKLLINVEPYKTEMAGTYAAEIQILTGSALDVRSDKTKDEINIYPNPSSGIFNINLNGENLKGYSIFNSLGEKIEAICDFSNDKILTFSLSNFPSGVYFIKLDFGNYSTIKAVELNK